MERSWMLPGDTVQRLDMTEQQSTYWLTKMFRELDKEDNYYIIMEHIYDCAVKGGNAIRIKLSEINENTIKKLYNDGFYMMVMGDELRISWYEDD